MITGICFFCHDRYVYAFNLSFRIKMLLIVVAGLNALWFQLGVFMDVDKWVRESKHRASQKSYPLVHHHLVRSHHGGTIHRIHAVEVGESTHENCT